MKQAFDILKSIYDEMVNDNPHVSLAPFGDELMTVNQCLKAMEEYASQFQSTPVSPVGEQLYTYENMMDIAGWMAAADCTRPIAELKKEAEFYISKIHITNQPAAPVEGTEGAPVSSAVDEQWNGWNKDNMPDAQLALSVLKKNGIEFDKIGYTKEVEENNLLCSMIEFAKLKPLALTEKVGDVQELAVSYAAYNYAKAPKQTVEDAEYIQAVSVNSFISGYTAKGLSFTREQMEVAWNKGVEWGDANCEFGGETVLPKFDEWFDKAYPVSAGNKK